MAGFSFGGSTPTPAAGAPASTSTGGFSFGAASASTPAPAASAPVPAVGGGFGFGASTPAVAPTPAPAPGASTGGFSFGGTAAPATPAPATAGGFSFGGTTATATTPVPVATPAAAPAFSLTGAASTLSAAATNTNANTTEATMAIPQFESPFPNLSIHSRIESILSTIADPKISSTDLTLQGQELVHLLSNQVHGPTLSNPSPINASVQNSNSNTPLRQKLTTDPNPTLLLPTQTSPQPIPRRILSTILTLSSHLNLSPQDAGALYGASIVDQLSQADVTLGEGTVTWLKKRKVLPCHAGKGFVYSVLDDHVEKGTYVGQCQLQNDAKMDLDGGSGGDKDEINCAMDLYFLERGQGLETLRVLIQHRISAASACVDGSTSTENGDEYDGALDLNTIILQATDQLLEGNLISNLVQLVKDLTVRNEELSTKICLELDREELGNAGGQNAGVAVGAAPVPAPAPAFGGFGRGFGSTTLTPAPASASASGLANANKVTDADYAMYQFSFQQRQLACQCLFYLAYHTQYTMKETTALIDLIRDLTNGQSNGDGGIGSGLPVLDPLRDVPDPYTVSWNQDGGSLNNSMQMNMGMGMAPQQIKTEKKHDKWKQELFSSLWSVRGLSRATVTTSHADFSGQQLYHAMTLKSSTNVGGIDAVGGGKPQLMQSVSSLILAAMCALDGSNVLMDRKFHGPNPMGGRNALVPIDNISVVDQTVKPISDRVAPDSAGFTKWKRQDIAGLLSAAFALLLRPIADVLASPVSRNANDSSALKALFRSSLENPAVEKSITFARTSLIPCLGSASMKSSSPKLDNDFAFFMSVLSEFTAKYLDAVSSFGELPISRQKWRYNEEQELQLRRVQEQQRKQLQELTGTTYNETRLPTEVDVADRPDCIDDIIALAISLCSSCPDCSYRFWSNSTSEEDNGNLVYHLKPSKIMKKLEKLLARDDSLLSLYVSFLSVLALTNNPNESSFVGGNGADTTCEWLSQNDRMTSSPTSYDASKQVSLEYILYSIQYYAQQLNPPAEKSQSGWNSTDQFQQSSSMYDDDSTSYYYGADDVLESQSKSQEGGSNSAASGDKKRELDGKSARILSSLLDLLSNVALKSEKSRKKILEIKLGSVGQARTREDDAITILFSLLVTSISPEIRGLTLSTIANLIRQSENYPLLSSEDKEKSDDTVMKCWELLDLSQIIPIAKLGQYSPLQNENAPSYSRSYEKKEAHNWLPPNEEYGIVYEMEYVESKLGSYPSTEGLLKLLAALFSSEVLPANLGATWRPQTGCTPYIEYVTDFVLPRALQVKNKEAEIYFATPADKSRLVTRALEVIDAVLTRYVPSATAIPRDTSEPNLISENLLIARSSSSTHLDQPSKRIEAREDKPTSALKHDANVEFSLVCSSIFPKYANAKHVSHTKYDFSAEATQVTTAFDNTTSDASLRAIPRPKSPGYVVLADILSSNGSLVDLITQLLIEEFGTNIDSANNSSALSLFGEFMPAFHTAKAGRDYILDEHKRDSSQLALKTLDSAFVELFLHPLLSETTEDISESPLAQNDRSISTKGDTQLWRECSILLSLRILCAAAARNDSFSACSNSSHASSRIIPVMRFQSRELGLNNPLLIKNVQLTKLSKRLLESSFDSSVNSRGVFLTILSQYIGYESSSLKNGNAIALTAMSLVKHIYDSSSSKDFVRSIRGFDTKGHERTTMALSTRLSLIPLLKGNEKESSLCDEILSLILRNLEQASTGNENLAHILLGLTGHTFDQQRQYLLKSLQGIDVDMCQHRNALDAILDLLSDVDFILDPKTSSLATKCFEVIYRLCDWRTQNSDDSSWIITKLCVMNKLRKSDFWQMQLLRFLGSTPSSTSILRITLSQSPIFGQSFHENNDISFIRRDSDVLHCVSWLLKGVALELHSLMGAVDGSKSSNLIGKFPTSSPQPQQCRRLLQVLLCENSCVLFNALADLPLTKPPHFVDELLKNKPQSDAVTFSSCNLREPGDVSSGFTAIDAEKLCRALSDLQHTDDHHDSAKMWAEAWNCYVNFACSSSHITKSWSFLTSTIYSSCKELLLEDHRRSEAFIHDGNASMLILKTVLSRLCGVENGRISCDVLSNCLDKGALFALSSATIPIVDTILDLHRTSCNGSNVHISEEHSPIIISLLVDGIANCGNQDGIRDGLQEEIAAIFASILSAILESDLVQTNNMVQSLSSQISFRNKAIDASTFLTSLSCRDLSIENSPASLSVTDAARSGLSSLLKWFDDIERNTEKQEGALFLFELFATSHTESSLLSQIVHLISARDGDAPNLLETIACCQGGTELLVQAGITEALHVASSKHLQEISSQSRSSYGYTELNYSQYVYGHTSLLSTMLASNVPEHCLQRLLSGTAKIIGTYQGTIESLFQHFPENEDLLFDFVTILALISDAMKNISGMHSLHQLFDASVLSTLDKRMEEFAFHVCQYPYPNGFLPVLPSLLRDARSNQGHTNDICWWDNIREISGNGTNSNLDAIILPNPPAERYHEERYSNNQGSWNLHGYKKACSAVECVDTCLTYMMNRVGFSPESLQVNGISLAVALHRSLDTARAIENRLQAIISSDEDNITSMLSHASIWSSSRDEATKLKAIKHIEESSLQKLGSLLASCVVKLLHLTEATVENTARLLRSGSSLQSYESMQASSRCLQAVLNNAQIETQGIGCLDALQDSESISGISKGIVVKLKSSLSEICR